ncbi:SCO family protein [Chromobacterium violaceum]|uniref:SCO family protein n=1 Tax=Chromobacterium violaceum TaxID=536 RepID=UPI000C1298D3|nr:SCO family protein [Chromobacterium violaceum]ATP28586.1 SCO family protein [Chromobacterium violaceum]ATP32496.1 SCO family protein [Chromobacterium violaceum]
MRVWKSGAAACLLAFASHWAWAGGELPGDSLYRLEAPLTTQRGDALKFSDLAGKPALITMFYGDCKLACPIVMEGVKSIIAALPARKRDRPTVLMVSLNPGTDTPASLSHLAGEHGIRARNWLLAVGKSDEDTRGVAAALGIRYRRLDSGEINHSTRIVVADKDGRISASTEDIGPKPDPAVVKALRALLK